MKPDTHTLMVFLTEEEKERVDELKRFLEANQFRFTESVIYLK